jgi:hypothetical protein
MWFLAHAYQHGLRKRLAAEQGRGVSPHERLAAGPQVELFRTGLLGGGASPVRKRLAPPIPGNREKYRVNLPFSKRALRRDSWQSPLP